MKNLITVLMVALLLSPAIAGDYMLFISDDNSSPCTEPARKVHEWCKSEYKDDYRNCEIGWPIKSAKEVSSSFVQYFNGEEPSIGILRSAFANGHFNFCGSNEVETVYQTLVKLKKAGVKTNKAHLDDFIAKVKKLR